MSPAPTSESRLSRTAAGGSEVLAFIERRFGITAAGVVLVALTVGGWALGRATGSQPMFLMAYGLLLLVVVAWVVGRRKLAVEASRSDLPTRVREGQNVEVELTLRARRRISAIVLEEVIDARLGAPVRVTVPLLPSGHEVTHPYTFSPRRRGVFQVGPLVAEWSDPFGLTRRRQVISESTDIIVHPSTELVHDRILSRQWEDPPIRPPVSKPWPTGFEFYGMRDYVSGDDPRRIVWRATARLLDPVSGQGRYLVRESEQGITDRVNIFLDTDSEFHSPGDPSETFETAVRTVASLGARHLKDGFSVSLETNGGRLAKALRGETKRIMYLDHLAAVQQEKIGLAKSLERLLLDPDRSSHNVIVTPHLEVQTASRLRLLRERGTSMLLVIILWEDTEPATLHRAGSLGINVVEVSANLPLDRVFRRVMGMARR